MTLFEYTRINQNDFDTYDDTFEACITYCYIDEADMEDNYDKFCNGIIRKVNVIEQTDDCSIVCDWTKLIKDNWNKFKEFTAKHWGNQYEDDEDEFIYQWINEIHYYMAGYVSEKFYDKLVEFVDSLEYIV